ncbi:hypothetical protein [Ruminococcus flavefaciens]|uniref:hypothetical protein n=1 Tax=Ruminococcus flavefaciens TaxID=1265 RepID=UPI0026EA6C08|nr:hypothetical protein [Ruminococcus flavefaciens]
MIPILSVNGVDCTNKLQPAKEGYTVTKSDLYADSTGRSAESGVMLAYLIRRDVYSLALEYVGKAPQIREIEQLFAGASRQYQVTFLDNDQYVTANMYPSDRTKTTTVIVGNDIYMKLSVSLVQL